MTMKKLAVLSILFISFAFVAPIQVSATTNAGVKPGSFFYFFDTNFEKVNLFFTFNPEKKAQKALEYANERLAEIETIAEEKNPDAVKAAITNYESNVALATEKSKEVKDKGQAENLLTLIEDNTSRNQEILSAVLIKVPEEAKEAIMQAIEASRKGQEEATKQIAELKGEIEQLKKEVAELKKESNDLQANEVERLKKEVEELKKKQSATQSTPKQTAPTTQNSQEQKKLEEKPKTTTDGSSSQRQNYDQELSQLIAQTRQNISVFNQVVDDTNNFISIVRNDMSKYSSDIIIQQSGQELINEANNLISISRKLVEIETSQINKLSSYLGLNIVPPTSEFSSIVTQYQNYYGQYETSNTKIELLMKTFVLNEKSVLEMLIQQTRQQTQDLKTQYYYETPPQPSTDSRLEYALSELRNTLSNISNEQTSSVVVGRRKEKAAQDWMQQNSNVFSYPSYVAQFNSILSSHGLYYMVVPQ